MVLKYHFHTSGFIGSPTVPSNLNDERSNEENVTSDWRAVIDNPKTLKPNVALVATLQPYEVLMVKSYLP